MMVKSPVQQICFAHYPPIWVKRDDLADPFISGNKFRKLKYHLIKARTLHRHHLVTFGGPYSNHLLAVAAAASREGWKATAFVRGEEVHNEMLLLCRLFGMRFYFTERSLYKNKAALFDLHFGKDPEAFMIDEGGAGWEGARGCMEIVEELDTSFDHIFCAAGTGTTAAGLHAALHQKQSNACLHVIPVLKGIDLIDTIKAQHPSSSLSLQYHTHYHFGGYAKTNESLLQFICDFTAQTGLLVDPVYTGKMFYAIYDLIGKGVIPEHQKVLAIHTGGLFGILGMKDRFRTYVEH